MSSYPDLYLHIKTLSFLGLICCHCTQDNGKKLCIATCQSHEWRARATFFLVQLLCFIILLNCILCTQYYYVMLFNDTGNLHSVMIFGSACLIISCSYGYLYVTRARNIQFLKDILIHYNDMLSEGGNKGGEVTNVEIKHQFYIYVTICSLNSFIAVISFHQGLGHWSANVTLILVHTFVKIVVGIVISTYVSITQMLTISMRRLNDQLTLLMTATVFGVKVDIQKLIKRRNRLLRICCHDLNPRYGLILLLAVFYTLLAAPSGPFIIISIFTNEELKNKTWLLLGASVVSIIWTIPCIVMWCIMAKCGDITIEANRTIKILLRIPVKKGQNYKMTHKILWKHLQQKPILNVLGLFTLNSRTLFTLLSTIMGYIIIMVQFNELNTEIGSYEHNSV
uniref:Gustatory receptor n=1 Tax=Stomoxys calcitrans TaxID=35570 RepID=A0A905STF8_STOCA